jgi:hypothetical protein
VNPFAAVAIIIAVFFVAGLMVGFLIVMALPALAAHRGIRRVEGPREDSRRGGSERGGSQRTYDGQRPRWPEPQGWHGTRPFGAGLDGDDDTDDTDDLGDLDGPPGGPWWHDDR